MKLPRVLAERRRDGFAAPEEFAIEENWWLWKSLLGFALGWAAGFINSMAGGATLFTFPALIWLGLDPKSANATSTVGLWPGSIGGAWGYRREIRDGRRRMTSFVASSFLGGAVGAFLLLATSAAAFRVLVPWLILFATVLFAMQKPIMRWFRWRRLESHENVSASRTIAILAFQFLVSVYGGYFGAGIGVLMLAGLGFLGVENLHERNGLKNVAAAFINGVAAILLAYGSVWGSGGNRGIVQWPLAASMAAGSLIGGYWSAGIARRVGPALVRAVVLLVGFLSALWAFFGSP